jgi:hypothetical protein
MTTERWLNLISSRYKTQSNGVDLGLDACPGLLNALIVYLRREQ